MINLSFENTTTHLEPQLHSICDRNYASSSRVSPPLYLCSNTTATHLKPSQHSTRLRIFSYLHSYPLYTSWTRILLFRDLDEKLSLEIDFKIRYGDISVVTLLSFKTKFGLNFRHRASSILGQAFRYSPENAFYIFNQQIYFIIWYLLDRASLI